MILLHSNGLFEQENWFKKYTFLYVAYIQILVMMELKTCKYFFNFKNILPVNVAEAKIARVHVNLWNIQETWLSKRFWSNLSICKINNATKHYYFSVLLPSDSISLNWWGLYWNWWVCLELFSFHTLCHSLYCTDAICLLRPLREGGQNACEIRISCVLFHFTSYLLFHNPIFLSF